MRKSIKLQQSYYFVFILFSLIIIQNSFLKTILYACNLIICDWNLLRKLNQQFSELYQILDGESSYQCEGEGAEVRGEQKEEHDLTQCDDSPNYPFLQIILP